MHSFSDAELGVVERFLDAMIGVAKVQREGKATHSSLGRGSP
jgi:hypothetical protein